MFVLKIALRPSRLAPLSHLVSAVAVGFLLLLAGFLYWLQAGLSPVVARLQGEQVITAYLEPAQSGDSKVVDSIRVALGAHAESTDVRVVSPQQFMADLKGSYPDLSRELEDLGSEADAIVPRYVSIAGVLPDSVLERVRLVPGVERAETSKNRYARIVGAFAALRWMANFLIAGMALALLTGLVHLSRINAYLHREALQLLKLWGAGGWALRGPGMISGALVGAFGGALACAGWLSAEAWLTRPVRALSPMLREMPRAPLSLAAGLLLAGILIGLLAGALGGSGALSSSARADGRR